MGVVVALVGLDGEAGVACAMFYIFADDVLVDVDNCLHMT